MRDRLIELLNAISCKTGCVCSALDEGRCSHLDSLDRCQIEAIAEHLLENGVLVPPCKVGQTVYVINSLFMSEYSIKEIAYDDMFFRFYCENEEYAIECRNFMFFDERIGKTVFFTREAAKQALKEREQG